MGMWVLSVMVVVVGFSLGMESEARVEESVNYLCSFTILALLTIISINSRH